LHWPSKEAYLHAHFDLGQGYLAERKDSAAKKSLGVSPTHAGTVNHAAFWRPPEAVSPRPNQRWNDQERQSLIPHQVSK
jgi:hypothetical protein